MKTNNIKFFPHTRRRIFLKTKSKLLHAEQSITESRTPATAKLILVHYFQTFHSPNQSTPPSSSSSSSMLKPKAPPAPPLIAAARSCAISLPLTSGEPPPGERKLPKID